MRTTGTSTTEGEAPRPLCIVGPTATGKTALAVAVAVRLGDVELVNADSRQTVRGLPVGTCAPTAAELRSARCHLLGVRDPGGRFSAAAWLRLAREAVADIEDRGRRALVVGGTGLYVEAFVDGLVEGVPPAHPAVRRRREAEAGTASGLAALLAELGSADPAAPAAIDCRNPRRVVRALEIVEARGSLAAARVRHGGRPSTMVGLDAPRALHHRLVDERSRRLFETGALLEEVDSALARGISRDALDATGIGYREALAVRDGLLTPAQAADALGARTRRYAKAQRTWFRRDPRIRWLERGEAAVETLVDEVLDALHQDARPGQRLPGRR